MTLHVLFIFDGLPRCYFYLVTCYFYFWPLPPATVLTIFMCQRSCNNAVRLISSILLCILLHTHTHIHIHTRTRTHKTQVVSVNFDPHYLNEDHSFETSSFLSEIESFKTWSTIFSKEKEDINMVCHNSLLMTCTSSL